MRHHDCNPHKIPYFWVSPYKRLRLWVAILIL